MNNYTSTNWIDNLVVDQFLETYNSPRLNNEEMENLNRTIARRINP